MSEGRRGFDDPGQRQLLGPRLTLSSCFATNRILFKHELMYMYDDGRADRKIWPRRLYPRITIRDLERQWQRPRAVKDGRVDVQHSAVFNYTLP